MEERWLLSLTRKSQSHLIYKAYGARSEHALGIYRPTDKHIAIRPGLSHTQAFKTLCHETAHMLLHTGSEARHSAELEAETTAFLVANALGIDTSTYSFAYLAGWTDTLDNLIQAGDRASKAADQILQQLLADPDANEPEPDFATSGLALAAPMLSPAFHDH